MKNSRTRLSELKLQNALDYLRTNYSTTEYREWNPTEVASTFEIGVNFVNTLIKLGAIKRERGNRFARPKLMLTSRFASLKPSTLRKNMNRMMQEYIKGKNKKAVRTTKKISTPKQIVAPTKTSNLEVNDLLIMLKSQIRTELLQEIKQQLASELITNK